MYGSAAGLKNLFSTHRISAVLQTSTDVYLEELIAAASAQMDAHLQQRYNVPIDTTLVTDATQKTMLDAWLEKICYGYVATMLFASSKDTPKAAILMKDFAERTIEKIGSGKLSVPYFPKSNRATFGIVGTATNRITQTLFDNARIDA